MDELELVGKRDLAVYAAQKWVNKTYKGKAGYEKTDEDGAIGNGTVSSLVRALQIELGISEVDGAYGKGTQAKVPTLSKGCESKDNISTNLIRILQYGLYCKGYGTDHEVDGKFGKGTEDAIKRIQEDIGIKSTGEVNGLLFRAILNTDGYVLDKNEGDNNVRKFQKIINKHYY